MAISGLMPPIHPIRQLELPAYDELTLPNGMPLYTLIGGSEPVMKMVVVFRAGSWYEKKPGQAEIMAALLSEGTQKLNSASLAEFIESRGGTMQTRGGVDTIRIRLYTLTRFLPELLDILVDVMSIPLFDEDELKVFAANRIERLKIELKKNEVLAYRYLTEAIFGSQHPYGRNVKPDDYLALTTHDLRQHHQAYIQPSRGMIFAAGSFGAREIDLIEHKLGQWQSGNGIGEAESGIGPYDNAPGVHIVDGPQSHQAAIRIGRKLFNQDHPDYPGMYVLNTILGGYFGSRLMTEIRENLGMTYGIYSSVDSFARDGCFYISTETATDNVQKVIDAIYAELYKLQLETVPDHELQMARNYIMGHMMTQFDGAFSSLDYIKAMKIEGLDNEHFTNLISVIQQITPEELRELAKIHLEADRCVSIVVK